MSFDLACTITGAAGFVGSHLCRALMEQDEYRVRVFAIDQPGANWNRIRDLNFDGLNNVNLLTKHDWDVQQPLHSTFLGVDAVYHFAGIADPKRYLTESIKVMDLNLMGLKNILERVVLWSGHRPRIIYSSTSEVYAMNEDIPFVENESLHVFGPATQSRWCYALSKLVGEHYLQAYSREHKLRHTIFRFFNFVGDDIDAPGAGRVLTQMTHSAVNNGVIHVTEPGTQTRCFTHIDESVVPLVKALTMKRADPARWDNDYTVNLGSDEEVSMHGLAMRIAAIIDEMEIKRDPVRVEMNPPEELYGLGYADVQRRQPSTREAEHVFGWRAKMKLNDWLPDVVKAIAERSFEQWA